MCVLSIKVPIQKKSRNVSYAPRTYPLMFIGSVYKSILVDLNGTDIWMFSILYVIQFPFQVLANRFKGSNCNWYHYQVLVFVQLFAFCLFPSMLCRHCKIHSIQVIFLLLIKIEFDSASYYLVCVRLIL